MATLAPPPPRPRAAVVGGGAHKEFPALAVQPKLEISFPQKESQSVMMIDRKIKPLGLPQGPRTLKLKGFKRKAKRLVATRRPPARF